jgi:hypothetical protein
LLCGHARLDVRQGVLKPYLQLVDALGSGAVTLGLGLGELGVTGVQLPVALLQLLRVLVLRRPAVALLTGSSRGGERLSRGAFRWGGGLGSLGFGSPVIGLEPFILGGKGVVGELLDGTD